MHASFSMNRDPVTYIVISVARHTDTPLAPSDTEYLDAASPSMRWRAKARDDIASNQCGLCELVNGRGYSRQVFSEVLVTGLTGKSNTMRIISEEAYEQNLLGSRLVRCYYRKSTFPIKHGRRRHQGDNTRGSAASALAKNHMRSFGISILNPLSATVAFGSWAVFGCV
jgi:hypothetical protein